MRNYFIPVLLCLCTLTVACSPSLNWREVRPAQTPLLALFPCKPQDAERRLPLGDQTVLVRMLVCEAEGATFTLAYAQINPELAPGAALALWQAATLRQAQAQTQPSAARPFSLTGALALPQSVKVAALGLRPNGSAVALNAVWFAQGSTVFQAAVYRSTGAGLAPLGLAAAETYFEGLKFQ